MAERVTLVCDVCGSKAGVHPWRLQRMDDSSPAVRLDLCKTHGAPLVSLSANKNATPVGNQSRRRVAVPFSEVEKELRRK